MTSKHNMFDLNVSKRSWRLREPFEISRDSRTQIDVVVVRLCAGEAQGLGEAVGVRYHDETPDLLIAQIEGVRAQIEAGVSREDLLKLLSPGGARNAVDAAIWDLETKQTCVPVWQRAGIATLEPLVTAVTIGIRSLDAYGKSARSLADHPWIKVKVGRDDPLSAISIVRHAAPDAKLIVDPNQAWSIEDLISYVPRLQELGVDLLEQPIAANADDGLVNYRCPIPICADEAVQTTDDLPRVAARYDFVNIKLDKTGGLTSALALAAKAQQAGLRLMVGCMVGGSVAMAPAMVLGQMCEICDLDGPLLQDEDWPNGIEYRQGRMSVPWPILWG